MLEDGITRVSDEKSPLTEEACRRILEMPAIEDTEVDTGTVRMLLRSMRTGAFHPEWVQIITCICDEKIGDNPAGTEYRINGCHVCWARLYMPDNSDCEVRFRVFRAKTAAAMRSPRNTWFRRN